MISKIIEAFHRWKARRYLKKLAKNDPFIY